MLKEIWIKRGATALLFAMGIVLLWGVWSLRCQQELAKDLVRFHVIAASDSREDQELKLKVRDAVLEEAVQWLLPVKTQQDAEMILREHLGQIEEIALKEVNAWGKKTSVKAYLTQERYPTRDYGTFSLPSGDYLSLRVVIGEGEGQNWWCVVFPPLCTSVTSDLSFDVLSEEETALITKAEMQYELRFKSIELWEKWIGNCK